VLGAVLDLTSGVLAALPTVRLAELPRMADFARILAALDHTCGWTTLDDCTAAVQEANRAGLDGDPVADAVLALVGEHGQWAGTASELLAHITPSTGPRAGPAPPRPSAGHSSAWPPPCVPAVASSSSSHPRPDPDHHPAWHPRSRRQQREILVALVAKPR
jgi:hypothetical protein